MTTETKTLAQLALPIIELSLVEMVMYDDGSGCFHINVHYLFELPDNSELVGEFSGNLSQVKQLALINDDTAVRIVSENGTYIGETTIGKIKQ